MADDRVMLCAKAICDSEASLAWDFIEARCGEPFSDDRYREMRGRYIQRARYVLAFLEGAQSTLSATASGAAVSGQGET